MRQIHIFLLASTLVTACARPAHMPTPKLDQQCTSGNVAACKALSLRYALGPSIYLGPPVSDLEKSFEYSRKACELDKAACKPDLFREKRHLFVDGPIKATLSLEAVENDEYDGTREFRRLEDAEKLAELIETTRKHKTFISWDAFYRNLIQYIDQSGKLYIWRSGEDAVVKGSFEAVITSYNHSTGLKCSETTDRNNPDCEWYVRGCSRYFKSKNPLTGGTNYTTTCEKFPPTEGRLGVLSGDPFGLNSGSIPIKLSRDRTSIAGLLEHCRDECSVIRAR